MSSEVMGAMDGSARTGRWVRLALASLAGILTAAALRAVVPAGAAADLLAIVVFAALAGVFPRRSERGAADRVAAELLRYTEVAGILRRQIDGAVQDTEEAALALLHNLRALDAEARGTIADAALAESMATVQVQDIVRQRLEQAARDVEGLGRHAAELAVALRHAGPVVPVEAALLGPMEAAYVMQRQRTAHLGAPACDAAGSRAAAIELF